MILKILETNKKAIKRKELCDLTGYTDRSIRNKISSLRRSNCIINLQDGKGYYIPPETSEGAEAAQRFYNQESRRHIMGLWTLKGIKDWLDTYNSRDQVTMDDITSKINKIMDSINSLTEEEVKADNE